MPRFTLSALALAVGASLAFATPALAGPPWIAVELPANPLDRATRGAFLLVHSYHHDAAVAARLTGRAVGMVDGRRQVIPLEFSATSRAGVSALRQLWPEQGRWVLVLTVDEGHGGATALVGVVDGQVRSVRVPSRRDGQLTVPRNVTEDDVTAELRQLAAGFEPAERGSGLALVLGALGGLVLIPAGLVVSRLRSA